jgi:hypothetical protein
MKTALLSSAELLQSLEGIGILAHQEYQRRRLPIRPRSPLLPFLERSHVILNFRANTAREQRNLFRVSLINFESTLGSAAGSIL